MRGGVSDVAQSVRSPLWGERAVLRDAGEYHKYLAVISPGGTVSPLGQCRAVHVKYEVCLAIVNFTGYC